MKSLWYTHLQAAYTFGFDGKPVLLGVVELGLVHELFVGLLPPLQVPVIDEPASNIELLLFDGGGVERISLKQGHIRFLLLWGFLSVADIIDGS